MKNLSNVFSPGFRQKKTLAFVVFLGIGYQKYGQYVAFCNDLDHVSPIIVDK